MPQSRVEEQKKAVVAATAAQQSDNIAHALAGAGGGILSMVLTWVFTNRSLWKGCRAVADGNIRRLSSAGTPLLHCQQEPKSNQSAPSLRLSMPFVALSSGRGSPDFIQVSNRRFLELVSLTLFITTGMSGRGLRSRRQQRKPAGSRRNSQPLNLWLPAPLLGARRYW